MHGVHSDGLFYGSRYWVIENGVRKYINSPSWKPDWQEGHDVINEVEITFSQNSA